MWCLPLREYDGFVTLVIVVAGAEKNFAGKEREVANFIVSSAGRLIKPIRRAPALELAPPPRRSSGADAAPGWLGRHSSRSLHGSKPYEPYVDLSPLDLTRRH